jgi:hypothetical protein
MPGIVEIVDAISDDVIAALAAAGLPPLVDGEILIGPQHLAEQSAAPRIVFVPVQPKWTPKTIYNRSPAATMGQSDEERLQRQNRSILTEQTNFEVHVWGVSDPPDPDGNYDATQILYQQVIRSVHLLAAGSYALSGGQWNHTKTLVTGFGLEFVFAIGFSTPIPDKILEYLPSDTVGTVTVVLQPGDGTTPNPDDAVEVTG